MLWFVIRLIFKTSSVTSDFFYVFNLILSFSTCRQSFNKICVWEVLGANVLNCLQTEAKFTKVNSQNYQSYLRGYIKTNQSERRWSLQPLSWAWKHATNAKRGKTGNRCQTREALPSVRKSELKPVARTRKHVSCGKCGKIQVNTSGNIKRKVTSVSWFLIDWGSEDNSFSRLP